MRIKCRVCGGYGFNLWQRGIDQGDLCDPDYWEYKYATATHANVILEDTLMKISGLSLETLEAIKK